MNTFFKVSFGVLITAFLVAAFFGVIVGGVAGYVFGTVQSEIRLPKAPSKVLNVRKNIKELAAKSQGEVYHESPYTSPSLSTIKGLTDWERELLEKVEATMSSEYGTIKNNELVIKVDGSEHLKAQKIIVQQWRKFGLEQ